MLQARRMRQRRSSDDVSILYLAILLVGFTLYLLYGLSITNRLLIVTNSVSIVATATTLIVASTLRNSDTSTATVDDNRC